MPQQQQQRSRCTLFVSIFILAVGSAGGRELPPALSTNADGSKLLHPSAAAHSKAQPGLYSLAQTLAHDVGFASLPDRALLPAPTAAAAAVVPLVPFRPPKRYRFNMFNLVYRRVKSSARNVKRANQRGNQSSASFLAAGKR